MKKKENKKKQNLPKTATTKPNKSKATKKSDKPKLPRKKIEFNKLMSDGQKVKDTGYYYTTNGIEVAIHKNNRGWVATELSTGKIAVSDGSATIAEAVKEIEKCAPVVKKVLSGELSTPVKIATEQKPIATQRQTKKTTVKQQSKPADKVKDKPQNKTPAKPTTPKKAEPPAEKRRVYKSMPKNYSVVQGTVAQPDGTILIHNGKPLFKQGKDGKTQQAKDRRGKPAHKVAALVVDTKAYNQAKNAERNAKPKK